MKINEWQIPSTIDILMEMQSLKTLSDVLSSIVKNLIDEEDSLISVPAIQMSVIEKPAINPCKTVPNVAGQDEIWPFQVVIIDTKSPSKSIETVLCTSTLGGGWQPV